MEKKKRLTRFDYFIMCTITLLYAVLSFYHLGSTKNPNTFVNKKNLVIELKEETEVDKIRYFTGHEVGKITMSYSLDNENYTLLEVPSTLSVFTWNDLSINAKMKYLKIEVDDKSYLGETALYDKNGQVLSINKDTSNQLLFDEQNTIPKEISSYNSSYFDEIYFARTAYEYANVLPAYEWVHPPLGKILISIPIKLFQMAPFYYRLMPNIAGILMIPVMYIFAKRLFKKTKYAALAGLLFALDGFHFAHTRMASVDPFLVLFLLLSFLFMYEYLTYKEEVPFKKKLFKLFLSGFFIGCAIATKWTSLFGALALAIFFFIHFFKQCKRKDWLQKQGIKILIVCLLFFVIIPLVLYLSLYLCFPTMYYFHTGSFAEIENITKSMFAYHSSLKADHPFYSSFYTWPLMIKPVWYYVGTVGGLKSTISGFGNPIVWWMGSISMLYMLYKACKKDKKAIFLLGTYLCLLLPYVGISRGMFLYHYFPAFPFTLLAITYMVKDFTEKWKKPYFYILVIILVVFFFFYFFPVFSGMPVSEERISSMQWLSTWIF
ncbi:MAG: phospholipid carrier-dependent glycosyltransferase [Bacilli bacterium]|nr:phospholipid carrier-dependent glycosyltransferase [Bacilli bacterium]